MNTCPICLGQYDTTRVSEERGLLEEYGKCSDNHHYYTYHFSYGNTSEQIGMVEFHSSYDLPKDVRELQTKQYRAILDLEREHYKAKVGEEKLVLTKRQEGYYD